MTEEAGEDVRIESRLANQLNVKDRLNVHVFISHKAEDAQAAKTLKDKLEPYGGDRLQFFLSQEIPAGTDWREWIYDHLGQANVLFFLCTKPTSTWDWCLYETGIFWGINKGRIIVLHSPEGQAPRPLEYLQSVPVTKGKIKEFLRSFFGTSDITGVEPPLAKKVAENDTLLDEMTESIAEPFAKVTMPQLPQFFHRHLSVRVTNVEALEKGTFPGDSVLIADKSTLELIGLGEKAGRCNWTWGELAQQRGVNQELVTHVEETIGRAARGELLGLPEQFFQGSRGFQAFRPVLYRLDVDANNIRSFCWLFLEQPIKPTASYAPPSHATLLSSVTLASRFHWEVYERFTRKMREWHDESQIANGCQKLREIIDNIQREADARQKAEMQRTTEGDRLRWGFEMPADREEVEENLSRQE